MAKTPFDKFMNNEPTGAKKKEMFKQEKRKAKAGARAAGEALRQAKLDKKRGIVRDEAVAKPPRAKKFDKAHNEAKNNKKFSEKGGKADFKKAATHQEADAFKAAKPAANTEFPKTKHVDKPYSKNYVRSNSDKYFKGEAETSKALTNSDTPVEQMPLNKFIAHAGVCGRREAAELVKQGSVTVNGDVVFEPGYKVLTTDDVQIKGKKLFAQKNLVYLLLNKPKDFITTSNDPEGRKTVMDLVKSATPERVYPVGRLDRNTTGVLLLTNDGELAQKLTHPSYNIKKIYEAKLDKPLTKNDFEAILAGITLEDGKVAADNLGYADPKDKCVIGIEIHSGRNRIVRRIFEHLGYEVKNLDRVLFANLSKKNVDRGKWRMLSEKEVRLLKYMNQSSVPKPNSGDEEGAIITVEKKTRPVKRTSGTKPAGTRKPSGTTEAPKAPAKRQYANAKAYGPKPDSAKPARTKPVGAKPTKKR